MYTGRTTSYLPHLLHLWPDESPLPLLYVGWFSQWTQTCLGGLTEGSRWQWSVRCLLMASWLRWLQWMGNPGSGAQPAPLGLLCTYWFFKISLCLYILVSFSSLPQQAPTLPLWQPSVSSPCLWVCFDSTPKWDWAVFVFLFDLLHLA